MHGFKMMGTGNVISYINVQTAVKKIPSEYIDYPVDDQDRMDELKSNLQEIKDEYVRVFVTERHENDALLGCVVVLVTVLLAFMFWIWFGSTIMRWML